MRVIHIKVKLSYHYCCFVQILHMSAHELLVDSNLRHHGILKLAKKKQRQRYRMNTEPKRL